MQKYWPYVVGIVVLVVLVVLKKGKQISPEQARALLTEGGRVFDVRTPSEYESGHVDGVENLPLDVIGEQISAHVPDLDTPIMLHCQGGIRSAQAVRLLRSHGYTNVHNLGSLDRARNIVEQP